MTMHSRTKLWFQTSRLWPCLVALAACSSLDSGTPDAASSPGNVDARGSSGGFSCTTGSLFAGNPLYDTPSDRPPDGTGIRSDPPFPYRTVVFSNGQMITHDGREIWRANLSDGKLHKLAGTESDSQALVTGPCAGSRFANIFSLALASDGSLFVSDHTANAILKITDPLGSGCTVRHYAGTPVDIAPGDLDPGHPPNVGNVDGPGAMAKFGLPERMAVDGDDNVYVWDHGNDAIRKIASDTDRTVSTFAPDISDGGVLLSEVVLGGKLYVYGLASSDVFLTSVDLTTGAKHDLFRGSAEIFGGGPIDFHIVGGIVTDGVGLILFYKGQLFYVSTDGTVLPALAGVYGQALDFSTGYDPLAPHDAADVEVPASAGFPATAGAEGFLAIDGGDDLYVTSQFGGNQYVERVSCAR